MPLSPTTPTYFHLLMASMLLCLCGNASAQLIWSEEFDSGSSPDESVWSYDLGSSGWGNFELQEYTDDPENIRIENGNLVITANRVATEGSSDSFTSARIRTEDKLIFRYGTIEARIKVPDLADGLWPAFWTLGNNFRQVGWPSCGELDILEMGSAAAISSGIVNRRANSAAHWEVNGQRALYSGGLTVTEDLDNDYHIYRMEWTPSLVTTYVDGKKIWAIDITSPSCQDCSEFHRAHFMILNLAVGGTYTQRFSSEEITAPTPAEMLVDWVRISDNGFTELGGSSITSSVIGAKYSGSWYNPGQSGHGFSMEFGSSDDGFPFAVIYWYTYDSLGNPLFMVGTGVPDSLGVDVQFESPLGMAYGDFDPDSVDREHGGTARIDFSDPDNGTFTYTPSAFSVSNWGHSAIQELPLTKLFGIPVSGTNDSQ